VKAPSGLTELSYDLKISFSNWWGQIKGEFLYKFWEKEKLPFETFFEYLEQMITNRIPFFDIEEIIEDLINAPKFIERITMLDKAKLNYGLGQLADQFRLFDAAERYYRNSVSSFMELGIKSSEAEASRKLGELLLVLGKTNEALENFERALELHRKFEDTLGLSKDNMSIGRYYLTKGEVSKSLIALKEAFYTQMLIPDLSGSVFNLLYQSEAFMTLNKHETAVACLILAKEFLYRIENPATLQSINHQIELMRTKIADVLGEQRLLELERNLMEQAEIIWHRELSRIG
jgi:tetratricopeptide (TPR) repeat protein